jgi:hypothetical protein
VFALAALALRGAESLGWGAAFAVIAVVNAALLSVFDQWEA